MSQSLSSNKLGMGLMVPVVPMLPMTAQVNLANGYLHLGFDGGAYVSLTIRGTFNPNKFSTVLGAIKAQPQEPSYSGSSSLYQRLSVKPVNESVCELMAGDTVICKVLIDPQAELISSDEPIGTQIQ